MKISCKSGQCDGVLVLRVKVKGKFAITVAAYTRCRVDGMTSSIKLSALAKKELSRHHHLAVEAFATATGGKTVVQKLTLRSLMAAVYSGMRNRPLTPATAGGSSLKKKGKGANRQNQREQEHKDRAVELRETIGVAFRERRVEPRRRSSRILAPTNSGKTHAALRFLADEGMPLRGSSEDAGSRSLRDPLWFTRGRRRLDCSPGRRRLIPPPPSFV